jgi:nicotinate-nucleotide pyrophosphorylase (carboxylating)
MILQRVNPNHVSIWLQPEPQNWWMIVDDALAEDVGSGDVTGGALSPDLMVDWRIEAQAEGVLSGVGICEYLLAPFGSDPEDAFIEVHRVDGEFVGRGQNVIAGRLPARRALLAERTALNFLMHMSGVATLTDKFVQKIEGTEAKIVDTRKTIPGLRTLQKYAVRCGGGHNHRMGLYDGAMIKDNHIKAAGSITHALQALRSYASHMTKIEVECETLDEVDEAVAGGADVILLDNMDPFTMRQAVTRHKGRCLFEASGGIDLDTVRGVAQTGVELISVGALTHSAVAMAFHMEID